MHRMLHRRDLLRLAAAASAGAVLTTSGLTAASAATPQLAVTATTSMIADALRVIGADRVAVTVRSDAVFRHGLYLEAQLEDFFETLQARVPVLALAEAAIPVADRLAHDAYENRFDPHVWMDPALLASMASFGIRSAVRSATGARPTRAVGSEGAGA